MGIQIIAVSPDRPEKIQKSLEAKQYRYLFLSDSNNAASSAFGIAFRLSDDLNKKYKGYGIDIEDASGRKDHILPVPAVFLVGTDQVIRFEYANPDYRVRLDIEVLMSAAKAGLTSKTK